MLVSILIPCYNAERFVGEAIESAVAQTWPDKEVIVVDDGSTDRSLNVIKSFGDRIRFESGPNRGGNVARNRLMELARGEWLQYVDADDWLLPQKVQKQVEFLAEHPHCDVVYSPVYWIDWADGRITHQEITAIPEPRDPWILLARWWLPQTSGPLFRKQSIVKAGSWKLDQPCCQEHELYLRLLESGAQFEYLDECHAAYRHWSQNETVSRRNLPELRRQRLAVMERLERFLDSRGELTLARMQALNQGRFEVARAAWLEDRQAATAIVSTIEKRQPDFVPGPPAARGHYRFLYRTFGFDATEWAAECARTIKIRRLAGRTRATTR